MVEGGMKCIKYLLFIFNLVFLVTGIALVSVGVLTKTTFHDYENFTDSEFSSSAVLLITVGVIILIIAFFGCCGALRESFCMVMTFAVLLGLIFILELAAGVAGYLLRDKISDTVRTEMNKDLRKYREKHDGGFTKSWNVIQKDLECCGVDRPEDWVDYPGSPYMNHTTPPFWPDSCCEIYLDGCNLNATSKPWPQGCYSSLTDLLEDNAIIIGGVGIGIAFIQILGVMFACCLARAIKKEYEVV